MNAEQKKAPCSRCGTHCSLSKDNPFRPFCSERCKMADLGDWFSERYVVPAETDEDFGELESTTQRPLQ